MLAASVDIQLWNNRSSSPLENSAWAESLKDGSWSALAAVTSHWDEDKRIFAAWMSGLFSRSSDGIPISGLNTGSGNVGVLILIVSITVLPERKAKLFNKIADIVFIIRGKRKFKFLKIKF